MALIFSKSTHGTDPVNNVKDILDQADNSAGKDPELLKLGNAAVKHIPHKILAPVTPFSKKAAAQFATDDPANSQTVFVYKLGK